MKNFIEMVNERIKNGDSLTIGRKLGNYDSLNSVVPYEVTITADSKIQIKTEDGGAMNIPECSEFSYDEFDDEYTIIISNMTLYIS